MPAERYEVERVRRLAQELMHHKRLYYAGHPSISDQEYDRLEEELRSLSPLHPALDFVGTDIISASAKASHEIPMLSLQKAYDEKTLFSWKGAEAVVGCWKLDGNSLALVYDAGRLVQAKTRGNGRIGEDVTDKARWVGAIIPELKKPCRVEVRGELFCRLGAFGALSAEMVRLGLERPSNPRNIVAGILGRKTHGDLARFFDFCAFDVIINDQSIRFTSEWQKITWLREEGFALPGPKLLVEPTEISAYLDEVKDLMNDDDIMLDGAVFTYDAIDMHEELGNTSHHPRYRISFKWQGETAQATISQVLWATSRYGVVTPVAVTPPVWLSGANITNITLHNALNVINNNIKAGDEIEIVRSGEVIPKFLRVVTAHEGGYVLPESCPSCGEKLLFDGVRLKCPANERCPAQNLRSILNFIKCMEIDDLSEKRLEKMIELGLVRTIPDLYRLTSDQLLTLPVTKQKMATKLLNNIAASKQRPLAQFLSGLSIEGAGLTTFEKLLEHFHDLAALRVATVPQIESISGFALRTAQQIVEGLVARGALIDELLAAGVTPKAAEAVLSPDGKALPLTGRQIVITGKLSMPRVELENLIKLSGGRPASAVSAHTLAVVTNEIDSTSTKKKKARELGIKVMNENDLLDMIHGKEEPSDGHSP